MSFRPGSGRIQPNTEILALENVCPTVYEWGAHTAPPSAIFAGRSAQRGAVSDSLEGTTTREKDMKQWKRPVIVEIQVGMEINLYVCAEL